MKNNLNKLNNWTITGLIDAEGSFGVNVIKNDRSKLSYFITIYLELGMNYKDKALLENIKETFNSGYIIYNSRDKTYKWKVSNLDDINKKIIPHFKKYFLLTQKRADFEIFVKIINIINTKKHLTTKGLQ